MQANMKPNMKPNNNTSRKKQRTTSKGIIICLILSVVLLAFFGIYALLGNRYQEVFFPNSTVNGLDVSNMTADEVKKDIETTLNGYTLRLTGRNEVIDTISGLEIQLQSDFDGSLEEIIENQSVLAWGFSYLEEKSYQLETILHFDEQKLEGAIEGMTFFQEENMVEPVDATISDYEEGYGYTIKKEELGSVVDQERLKSAIIQAVMELKTELLLEEVNVYQEPDVMQIDPQLMDQLEEWNQYAQVVIEYQFGDKSEVVDGARISQWIVEGSTSSPVLDNEKVKEFVSQLAKEYNTAYTKKTLQTTDGPMVEIIKGDYGWRINQTAEAAALAELIRSGQSQVREPIYTQTANSHGENDYGDTYVEVNLTSQHLYFYKDGELLVEADFVSGNASKGWETPDGAYPITYKQRNATLSGEDYDTPVDYWLPFNRNIGLHDAKWRSDFGGDIYKTSGSHGCINLPHEAAKIIYENISAGMPVLCYYLEEEEVEDYLGPTQESEVEESTSASEPIQEPEAESETTVENSTAIESEESSEAQEESQTEVEAPETSVQESEEESTVEPTIAPFESEESSNESEEPSSSAPIEVGPGV